MIMENNNQSKITILHLSPILFIVAIVPLIVFGRIIEIDGLEMNNWRGGSQHIDFFSLYKAIWFSIAAYVGFFLLLFLKFVDKLTFKKNLYYIPLILYAVFIILSTLFATDTTVALRGYIEMFQGVFVLIAYILTVIVTFNLVREERHVKAITAAFIFVGVVTAFIGIGQYFGYDIFRTDWGKRLILPSHLHHIADGLTFRFGEGSIYATMYNTNFVGSFGALMLPFSIGIYFSTKRFIPVVLSSIFVLLMAFTLFGSNSRAGIVGLGAASLFLVVLFRRTLIKQPLKIISTIVIILIAGFTLNHFSEGRVMRELTRLNLIEELRSSRSTSQNLVKFEDLKFEGGNLDIITEASDMRLHYDGNEVFFTTLDGDPIAIEINDTRITFKDEAYEAFRFDLDNEQAMLKARIYGRNIDIYLRNNQMYIRGVGGIGQTEYPKRVSILEDFGRFASSRGYIWQISAPLVFERIFIGDGPDMYPISLDQHDYIGRLNTPFNLTTVIDKPHNLFIQIGVNTGLISLLAFLSVYVIYFFDSLRLFLRNKLTHYLDYMGIGIFTGIIGYLGAGLFNDQIVSVAPLFYVMTGLGIAVNALVKRRLNEKQL